MSLPLFDFAFFLVPDIRNRRVVGGRHLFVLALVSFRQLLCSLIYICPISHFLGLDLFSANDFRCLCLATTAMRWWSWPRYSASTASSSPQISCVRSSSLVQPGVSFVGAGIPCKLE